ncbi:MAG: hypothetical protein ACFFAS_13210 [Promethearchaeota archaeon]
MTENLLIVKTKVLDPVKNNPFNTSSINFCRRCLQVINETELDEVFKITYGLAVGDVFFPEKRVYLYHKECLSSKK